MPAKTYRSDGRHIPVATASANLTGGILAWQEGFFGVVVTSCSTGESTELDAAGIHNILVPENTVKGDRLWATLAGDSATITLVRTGMTSGQRLIGEALSTRDTAGKALVKLAHQPSATYPVGGAINEGAITDVVAGTVAAEKAVVVDANKDIGTFRDILARDFTGRNIDAGESGTAGTVDIFPGTGSKGKAAISVTDQVGDTTVGIVVGAMAGARTLTIPDPLAAAEFLLGKQAAVARTATALGDGTGAIAAAGKVQFIAVTAKAGDATGIITLPTPTPGTIIVGYIGATGCELRTTDPNTIAINGGTGAAAESAIAANMMFVAICTSATSWHGFTITGTTLAALEAAA